MKLVRTTIVLQRCTTKCRTCDERCICKVFKSADTMATICEKVFRLENIRESTLLYKQQCASEHGGGEKTNWTLDFSPHLGQRQKMVTRTNGN